MSDKEDLKPDENYARKLAIRQEEEALKNYFIGFFDSFFHVGAVGMIGILRPKSLDKDEIELVLNNVNLHGDYIDELQEDFEINDVMAQDEDKLHVLLEIPGGFEDWFGEREIS